MSAQSLSNSLSNLHSLNKFNNSQLSLLKNNVNNSLSNLHSLNKFNNSQLSLLKKNVNNSLSNLHLNHHFRKKVHNRPRHPDLPSMNSVIESNICDLEYYFKLNFEIMPIRWMNKLLLWITKRSNKWEHWDTSIQIASQFFFTTMTTNINKIIVFFLFRSQYRQGKVQGLQKLEKFMISFLRFNELLEEK